jgi:hypothetical protein
VIEILHRRVEIEKQEEVILGFPKFCRSKSHFANFTYKSIVGTIFRDSRLRDESQHNVIPLLSN